MTDPSLSPHALADAVDAEDPDSLLTALLLLVHRLDTPAQKVLDGTLGELARRLEQVQAVTLHLTRLASDLSDDLGARMETDVVEAADGLWLTREAKTSVRWDADRVHADVRSAILRRLGLDRASGEMRSDWQTIASDALVLWQRAFSTGSPKVGKDGALRADFGLDPDDYRTSSPAGFKITLRRP